MKDDKLKIKNELKRKNASLTTEEWLTFFFLPFFTTKPNWREDHVSESELDRFEKYGFENKYREAQKAKRYGFLFWTSIIIIAVFILK